MYLKNKNLLAELLDDGSAILYDQHTEKTFILNSMGYYIFENIEERSVETLSNEIHYNMRNQNEYDVDEIHTYIENYTKMLLDSGLVVRHM